jgi:hypothetical protein
MPNKPENESYAKKATAAFLKSLTFSITDMSVAEGREAVWRNAFRSGCLSIIDESLRCAGMSPDTPYSSCGRLPLIDLVHMSRNSPEHEQGLIEITQLLLSHNATLNRRDNRGLYPADHALFGKTPEIARAIIYETLTREGQFNPGHYMAPQIEEFFISSPNVDRRDHYYSNLKNNWAAAQEILRGIDAPSDRVKSWMAIKLPRLEDMPKPSATLIQQGFSLLSLNKKLNESLRSNHPTQTLECEIEATNDLIRRLQTIAVERYQRSKQTASGFNRPEPSSPPPQP